MIAPSLRIRLEAPTLYDTGKSLSVGEAAAHRAKRPQCDTSKGYSVTHHSLLPMGGRGKSLRVWMRLGRANRPHAKEVLQGALSPTAHKRDW